MFKLILLLLVLLIMGLLLYLKLKKRCKNCIYYMEDRYRKDFGRCTFNRRIQKIINKNEYCKKYEKAIHYKKWIFFTLLFFLLLHNTVKQPEIVYVPVEKKVSNNMQLKNKEYTKQFEDIQHYKPKNKERIYIETIENVFYRNFRMNTYEKIDVKIYSINGQLGFKPGFERTINGKKLTLGGDYYIYQDTNPYHFWNFLHGKDNFNNHQFLFDVHHTDMLNQINIMEGCIYAFKKVEDNMLILKFFSDYLPNQWNNGFLCEMIIERRIS